jgi:drug/metabolite transporter (DMT)-like permease
VKQSTRLGPLDSTTQGRLCVLAAALLWSSSGAIAKRPEVASLDGPTIAVYRSLFAGLVLLPVIPLRKWVFVPAMIPAVVAFGIMVGLYLYAMMVTTAANAIFLQCSSSLWIVPLSALILHEPPDRRSLLGIAIAAPGILTILFAGHGHSPREITGVAAGIASGLAYAFVVIGLRGLRHLDSRWLAAINNLGGALVLAAGLYLLGGFRTHPNLLQVSILAAFGTFQMAIPYVLFARGLRFIGAAEAGLISLLEPILNPILVALFIGEKPAPATLVGGGFLLAGVLCRYFPFPDRATRHRARLAGSSNPNERPGNAPD